MNHVINFMAGRTLDFFIPPWAFSDDGEPVPVTGTKALSELRVPPVDSMGMIRVIADEEGVQGKCCSYMFGPCKIRGGIQPEIAHPGWNANKNALTDCGSLKSDSIKLTLIGNYNRGAFIKGDRLWTKQEICRDYWSRQDESYFEDLQESIQSDRLGLGHCPDDVEPIDSVETLMSSPSVAKRMQFIKS